MIIGFERLFRSGPLTTSTRFQHLRNWLSDCGTKKKSHTFVNLCVDHVFSWPNYTKHSRYQEQYDIDQVVSNQPAWLFVGRWTTWLCHGSAGATFQRSNALDAGVSSETVAEEAACCPFWSLYMQPLSSVETSNQYDNCVLRLDEYTHT